MGPTLNLNLYPQDHSPLLTCSFSLYYVSNHTKGIFTSTHSAFAFLPARAFLSKDEIKRMKKEIRDHPDLAVTPAQRKQQKLLEKWFDDPTQPQIEIITYPVRFSDEFSLS